jgi:hypothetical protein
MQGQICPTGSSSHMTSPSMPSGVTGQSGGSPSAFGVHSHGRTPFLGSPGLDRHGIVLVPARPTRPTTRLPDNSMCWYRDCWPSPLFPPCQLSAYARGAKRGFNAVRLRSIRPGVWVATHRHVVIGAPTIHATHRASIRSGSGWQPMAGRNLNASPASVERDRASFRLTAIGRTLK